MHIIDKSILSNTKKFKLKIKSVYATVYLVAESEILLKFVLMSSQLINKSNKKWVDKGRKIVFILIKIRK